MNILVRRDQQPSRRDLIRHAACAAVGTVAMTSTVWDLRMMNAAVAAGTSINDYKALVCLFLHGGNDANNFVVPYDATRYAQYAAIRKNLAIPQSLLLPLTISGDASPTYAFHPRCTGLQSLFAAGKCAVMANVGTLLHPITKAQYSTRSNRPPQLYSHNDQQVQWQTSICDQPPRTGWGGRCIDRILAALDVQANPNLAPKVSMSLSVAGSNIWEVGNGSTAYSVSSSGTVTTLNVSGLPASRLARIRELIDIPSELGRTNLHEKAFSHALGAADDGAIFLNANLPPASTILTPFPATSLGNQLKMIARLIAARAALNQKRQIFFCQVGGYDTHTVQLGGGGGDLTYTQGAHANLLGTLSDAVKAFHDETVRQGVADAVTLFTASDFGRTFPTNNADVVTQAGSDHAWGSHHVIVGGAVNGQKVFGTFPSLQTTGPDAVESGKTWIPQTSVDQYSATLAKWFGVPDSELNNVFPNLPRFASRDVGFMLP